MSTHFFHDQSASRQTTATSPYWDFPKTKKASELARTTATAIFAIRS
jgi:hypothetical protein